MKNLFVDQYNAVKKLRKYKVGALFMEPGTGKTRTAYELIRSVDGIEYILWLTPFQTKDNLLAEIDKCGGFDCCLDVVGIETLSSSDKTYLELISKLQSHKSFIVCDESLKIKNFEAIRTKRILHLGTLCEYKLILNGTPLSRDILDLWSQLEFLSPRILNMGIAEYKNTFVKYTTITKKIGGQKMKKEVIDGYENIDYLTSLIRHYVYECDLKLDVSRSYKSRYYNLDDEMIEEYNRVKEFMLNNEYLMFRNNNIFIELIQHLQHSYCCSTNKFEVVSDILKTERPEKTLIFCAFLKSQSACMTKLPDVRVLTYGKHSYGLNLQDYNTIIFFDKTLNYALRLQSERRVYRSMQTMVFTFYDLTGNVGLDRMINGNIEKKEDMLNYFKRVSFEQFMKEL